MGGEFGRMERLVRYLLCGINQKETLRFYAPGCMSAHLVYKRMLWRWPTVKQQGFLETRVRVSINSSESGRCGSNLGR